MCGGGSEPVLRVAKERAQAEHSSAFLLLRIRNFARIGFGKGTTFSRAGNQARIGRLQPLRFAARSRLISRAALWIAYEAGGRGRPAPHKKKTVELRSTGRVPSLRSGQAPTRPYTVSFTVLTRGRCRERERSRCRSDLPPTAMPCARFPAPRFELRRIPPAGSVPW